MFDGRGVAQHLHIWRIDLIGRFLAWLHRRVTGVCVMMIHVAVPQYFFSPEPCSSSKLTFYELP